MDLHPPMYLQTYHPDKESKFFIKIKDSPKEDYSKGEGEDGSSILDAVVSNLYNYQSTKSNYKFPNPILL